MESHLSIASFAARAFSNDGNLDIEELNQIFLIALADGKLDENEKRVLNNLFTKISQAKIKLDQEVIDKINSCRKKYNF